MQVPREQGRAETVCLVALNSLLGLRCMVGLRGYGGLDEGMCLDLPSAFIPRATHHHILAPLHTPVPPGKWVGYLCLSIPICNVGMTIIESS